MKQVINKKHPNSSSKDLHVFQDYIFKSKEGLNERIVRQISAQKNEPAWMLDVRLKALKNFQERPFPSWGPKLTALDMNNLYYYLKSVEKQEKSWDDVPEKIKQTFDRLGVPQSEKKYLAGLGAQYESEMVYHNLRKEWEKQGVIFLDCDMALQQYPEIFKKYFGTVVPHNDNKFAALNTAVWSGGSFIYVPKGVQLTMPLQTYFRINAERMGQFERTLIIADEGSFVHYIEGCTSPSYLTSSLHAAVVEIIAKPGARVRYSTIQNWSRNVYNLVTKRAVAYKDALIEWVDGNLGSGVTMKYPSVILKEPGARAEIISVSMANNPGQIQDSGAKLIHEASHTSSKVVSKSISSNGGRASYRGVVKVNNKAQNCKSFVQCDAMILDGDSRCDTYPYVEINDSHADVGHEASVSRICKEQLFYLMSRGLTQTEARTLIVHGFIEPFVKELPVEYAIEMNRLIAMEMEESVG
jgi:Fe-S cluster assembly protein SufB